MIKEKLRKDFKVVTDSFFKNYMSLNPTKCPYMCLGKNKENDTFNFEISIKNISIKNSKVEAILGLAIDNKLSFNNHGRKICRKASQNLCTFKNIKFRLETRKKFF